MSMGINRKPTLPQSKHSTRCILSIDRLQVMVVLDLDIVLTAPAVERPDLDAQVALEERDEESAEDLAYRAMLSAARALVRTEHIDVTEDPDDIVNEFRTRFFDTERFFDKYARGKFGQYLLERHARPPDRIDRDTAARLVEESLLFIEAAHVCEARISAVGGGGGVRIEPPTPPSA